MSTSIRFLLPTLAKLLFVFFAVVTVSIAQPAKGGPASKLYVVEVNGTATINNGKKIEPLIAKATYDADDIVIETPPGSTCVVVLSNGTAISLSSDTQLEIRRFVQEPFSPDRIDLDLEPSVSQTIAFLTRGAVALSTSNLVPGSTMIFSSRHSSVAIRGRKVFIETDDTKMIVSLLDGAATIRDDLLVGGAAVKAGEQAIVTRISSFSPPTVVVQPIPDSDRNRIEDAVAVASMARTTVYFSTTRSGGAGGTAGGDGAGGDDQQIIVVVPVLPGSLKPPVNQINSPYNLP